MSRLTVRIPDTLHAELSAVTSATGKSESEVLREALADYCQKHGRAPSCYELAQDLGLIGCVHSGVGDLSTNPAHLEGFGRE